MSTLQVDRIIPYLSASVQIEGAIQANGATTGSNTFTGDQNILGTLTASLQEGYAWVGGTGDVSILTATSSFGGGGSGFPFEGDAVISGSLEVTGSFKTAADGTTSTATILTENVGTGGRTNLTFSQPTFNSSFFVAQNPNDGGGQFGLNKPGTYQAVVNTSGTNGQVSFSAGNAISSTNGTLHSDWIQTQNTSGSIDRRIILGGASITHPSPDLTGHVPYIAIRTNTGGFQEVINFQDPSTYTDGSVKFLTSLNLQGQDPLPTGAGGDLAVSGSALYFHDGGSWRTVNLT